MKKMILAAAAGIFLLSATDVSAQARGAREPIYADRSGKEIKVEAIEANRNDYRIKYRDQGQLITKPLRRSEVRWVWIPMPNEVREADTLFQAKKYEEAANAYKEALKQYETLGWDVYCRLKAGEAYNLLGKNGEALSALESLANFPESAVNRINEADLMKAYTLLVNCYIQTGDFAKALPFLEKMCMSENETVASDAFILKGDVFLAKSKSPKSKNQRDDLMDAATSYFQAALLFPNSKSNPKALLAAYNALREAKDARAEKFSTLLKRKYPNSPEAKSL